MIEKIPFSSLKKNTLTENEKNSIKCTLCNGIFYEPIYSTKNKLNYCKTCFLLKNNINPESLTINYSTLYQPCLKQVKKVLNSYNYTCPNYDIDEKEYTYDNLINHLIICDNSKINCSFCGKETFLKNCEKNEKQKLITTLIRNKILERELEYQKSRIVEMEKEKKETKEKKEIKEKIEKKEKKEKIPRIKTVKKERIISKTKSNIIKPPRPISKIIPVKKEKLPPIRKNSQALSKKEEQLPKLNFKKRLNFKGKAKEEILDNSRNTTLFDKCPHFYGNYMPKFVCCNKFYGCYLCHNENEGHPYQFSNKVSCLFCKTVYAGKTCPKCKVNQLFKRKML